MSPTPRFRIDRELGLGTSGRVWHGVLTEGFGVYPAGIEIAVKYQHPELALDPRAIAAFEAEAAAGGAVAHPGLVHVMHAGSDAKGRYLVFPFVPGESLREVLATEGGVLPEPLVRRVGAQIAGGVAALHTAGYLHGDIKPENIRLDAEGNAVLLDLGFARRAGQVSPLAVRTVAPRPGSLPYISPEQARGEAGDVESDVFALGVVLYELCAGAHPFAGFTRHHDRGASRHGFEGAGSSGFVARAALDGPNADKLIAAIATARAYAPSHFVPQLSPFIDRLLLDVLQRDPARRPRASELYERLLEQETGAWWRDTIEFEAGARRGGSGEADARHLTPLVGRDDAFRELAEAWKYAAIRGQRERDEHASSTPEVAERSGIADHGGVVWIRGVAGSGKSRVVSEFASRARTGEMPPLFLYGRCRELEEERPCQPFLRMLERYLRLPPGVSLGPREREELAQIVPPRVAETLAQALEPKFAEETALSVPVALSEWLARLARKTPLLVFLDDVNWAGRDSLEVLSLVAETMKGARLLLVLGQRDDGDTRAPAALDHVRERLSAHVRTHEIALEPLDESAMLELVRRLFHHSAPRLRLARVLWQRSRGNAGLAAEIVRGLLARGDARPHADGGGLELVISPDDLPLPGSLRKAIADSYKRLPTQVRTWLRRLAVVGGRIETDFLLAAFPPAKRAEVDQVLAQLVRTGWLSASGARYRFTRPALREAVYRGLSRDQRTRLHASAAEALKPKQGEDLTLEDAFQRAFHLRAAGENETLLAAIPPLLPRLLKSGQTQRVHPLALWGLEAIERLPRTNEHDRLRIELLEAAADAADRLGMREDQRQLLDRMADLAIDPDLDPLSVGRVYLLHGRYAVSTGQYGLARGMLKNAVEMFERADAALEHSEALRRLSLVQSHVGELIEARGLARQALERSQTDAQKALAHLSLGSIDVLEDRVEPAMENTDAALALLRADPSRQRPGMFAAAHMLRARVYRSHGSPGRALAAAKSAVRLARISGERRLEAEALARLGGLLLDVDRAEESEARLRDALLVAEEIEDRRGQTLARTFLGILLWENDDPEAASMLARATRLAVEMGLNRIEALATAVRARIHREHGEMTEALDGSARAMRLLDQFGAELADRMVIAGTRALVLSTSGAVDEARVIEQTLNERIERENARVRSPLLRLRQRRVATRILEAVLSPEGPIYPRVRLEASVADE